ncbi:related to TOB3 (member of AAA-ATPase family) [Lecanosticta acicola]|uniref:Related to TOB3 (Member of AAA-ATPase family) n=1 Tax=Lecanosticta acicola TaxID=111012 RepID=A0AAI9EDC8_9PEZI|nr:related to TOB3 (member of AAA-ATPase family) [Lecanosticta acicola]
MASINSEGSSYQDIDDIGDQIDDNEESLDLGKDAKVKKLYRNKRNKWVDESPKEEKVQKAVRLAANSNYAIITRHYVEDEELCLDSIVVQNAALMELLGCVFEDYPALEAAFKSKRLIFEAPFRDFFYRWEEYEDLLRSEWDGDAKEYLQLFDSIIRPEVGPHVQEHKDILETGVARFDDAWTLFYPGAEVYTNYDGHERIYQFESVSRPTWPSLSIDCKYITWCARGFRWQRQLLTIFSYDGCKAITDLSVFPLALHPHASSLSERLSERGRRFEELSGIHYKSYNGLWTPRDPIGWGASKNLDNGRILIDSQAADSSLSGMESLNPPPVEDPFAGFGLEPHGFPRPKTKKGKTSRKYRRSPTKDVPPRNPFDWAFALDPDEVPVLAPFYRFCRPTVRGVCDFNVDNVSEIEFNPATFQRLVLPSDHKDLILAFVTSQMESLDSFDDIVDGKGRGITILLKGEPGVGKTLTAEAVAEEVEKPLYTLSAGDLGHDASSVEANLESMLDLCARWRAILLVDECDVFLEQRAATDIDRNKLVAVFLRLLEYYKGVIFLTTNRGGMIDRAFQSRIALVIQYPVLDFYAKKHIWETFVRPSVDFPQNDSDLTDADIESLAKLDINGREIKNLVKTGRLLARKKQGRHLSMGHIRTVLRVQDMLTRDTSNAQGDA